MIGAVICDLKWTFELDFCAVVPIGVPGAVLLDLRRDFLMDFCCAIGSFN